MKKGFIFAVLFCFSPMLSWSGAAVSPAQLAAQAAEKYAVFPMKPGYLEKDQRKGVVYFTAEEREQRRAVIVEGLVYDNQGVMLRDSAEADGGALQYVMDSKGNLYIFDDIKTVRHSSIFAGGPVAAAGDIQIENGRVTAIDANSGHYFVLTSNGGKALESAFAELAARGVNTNSIPGGRQAARAEEREPALSY